jgi:hypothetical protein
METCAECGKPIEMGQPSYYRKRPGDDIGQSFHSHCGDPMGLKASERRIREEERERCAKIAEAYRWDEIHNECCEGNMGWLLDKIATAIRNKD